MKTLLLAWVLVLSAIACMAHAEESGFTWVTYGNGTITITDGSKSITMMDKNLWATEVDYGASASTGSYGDYYQWRWTTGYAYSLTSRSAIDLWFITDDNEWSGTTANITDWWQGPCPSGYYVPTPKEWQEVINIYTWAWNSINLFYEAFMIPFAGYRSYGGANMTNVKSEADLWSASPYGDEGGAGGSISTAMMSSWMGIIAQLLSPSAALKIHENLFLILKSMY